MKTHIQYTIKLECKSCKYKNTKTVVLQIDTKVMIGCSQCKQSWVPFVVVEYASWSTTNPDLYVKIIK